MATNIIEAQIKDRISAFVAELDQLVRKSALEAVRGVLGNGAAPARRGRPVGSGRGPGRPAGAVNSGAADAIVAHVKANDGATVGEIARGARLAPAVAKKTIIKLLADGSQTKTGQRRGTRNHAGSGSAAASAPRATRTKRGKRRGKKSKAA
jgi:hypothetical protein